MSVITGEIEKKSEIANWTSIILQDVWHEDVLGVERWGRRTGAKRGRSLRPAPAVEGIGRTLSGIVFQAVILHHEAGGPSGVPGVGRRGIEERLIIIGHGR